MLELSRWRTVAAKAQIDRSFISTGGNQPAKVLRHIAVAKGAEISSSSWMRAENSLGFSESVDRTVKENSGVLGYGVSDFKDGEW